MTTTPMIEGVLPDKLASAVAAVKDAGCEWGWKATTGLRLGGDNAGEVFGLEVYVRPPGAATRRSGWGKPRTHVWANEGQTAQFLLDLLREAFGTYGIDR